MSVSETSHRRLVRIAVVGIVVLLPATPRAGAQDAVRRGISVAVMLGYGGGSPDRTDAGMRSAGFADTRPGGCLWDFCQGPTSYPVSYPDHFVSSISARYRHSSQLSVELLTVSLPDRWVEGYRHDPATGFGTYTAFERRGQAYVATVARHWKGAWFGAGPALVKSNWQVDSYRRKKLSSVGIALDAGIVLGRWSRLAPMLRAQYRAADGGSVTSETSGVRAAGPDAEFHIGLGFGFAL